MEIDNSLVRNDEANEEKISSVRPKSFKDFIGQSDAKNNLIIFAKSSQRQNHLRINFFLFVVQGLMA